MNPLSAAFGVGVALRNYCYDRGIFKSRKLTRPVVSIGNLSVGGSGKTPFVIALGQLLQERGIEFDVLSRGYGRSSGEAAVVHPEGRSEQFGDEPLLIARRLRVPVIVGASRYLAGLLAERQFNTKLHLLDDGFQHRALHRDFDIVLLPARDLQGSLLPTGLLREPLNALRRADAAVLEPDAPVLPGTLRVWRVRREIAPYSISARDIKTVVAFCGIAHPERFFESLKTAGINVVETVTFRDHHRYDRQDIERLRQLRASTGAVGLITTEKDAVKLDQFNVALQPLQIAVVKLQIESPEQVMQELLATLQQRGHKI